MVYVDEAVFKKSERGRKTYAHMSADSIEELHLFALSNGIKKHFFHRGSHYPHYDVTSDQQIDMIKAGAVLISSKELCMIAKSLFVKKESK